MRLQLWSWNYAPEPTAMGPIATLWTEAMSSRGHQVSVITAHPHYPPIWPQRWWPSRELTSFASVLRLPLVIGHSTTARRVTEEITFAVSASVAAPLIHRPDVAVVVTPSFLALQPVMRTMRARRVPVILWLQDILPDAAVSTGLLRNSLAIRTGRRLELAAYRLASRIVAISETFRQNLIDKGVSADNIVVAYNPATRGFMHDRCPREPAAILAIGNLGHSQGFERFVQAYADARLDARLVITGTGERASEVDRWTAHDGVEYLGLVDDQRLEAELSRASIGVVTQRPDVVEFNVPSRLMTMMARGLPILAFVRPESEVARIVKISHGGWVVDCASPESVSQALHDALRSPDEIARRGHAAAEYAQREFTAERLSQTFDDLLAGLVRT